MKENAPHKTKLRCLRRRKGKVNTWWFTIKTKGHEMSEEDESYRELKWKTVRHEKEIIKTKLRGLRTQQMFNYYSCKKNYHNSRLLYNKNMISKNKLVINILNRLKYVRISLFSISFLYQLLNNINSAKKRCFHSLRFNREHVRSNEFLWLTRHQ